MRRLASFCLLAALAAAPSGAQRELTEPEGEGVVKAIMSYPAGNPGAIARMTWDALRYAAREGRCRDLGCLILINDSKNYRLRGFYVRPVTPRTPEDWGDNQIEHALAPNEATVRFKLQDQRFCSWPVKFVLQNNKSKEVYPVETTASLCSSPGQDTVLKVRILKPEVYVDG